MHSNSRRSAALILLVVSLLACGCASSQHTAAAPAPPPDKTVPPAGSVPSEIPNPDLQTNFTNIVAGAGDSVGAIPGSIGSQYAYRFRQIDPGSDRFTFQDRDLSFYFRPTPNALHFQVENRLNHIVTIDWDRSTWIGPNGSEKIAHNPTRWSDRYGTQGPSQILGLQRYSDYMFPISYLIDPGSSGKQLHRVLFPEDQRAVQFTDQVFGVDLAFNIDNRAVPYSFRFKVASVVPR